MRRSALLLLVAVGIGVAAPRLSLAGSLVPDGRAGVVTAIQGVAVVRPVGRERWTPLDARSLLFPGDVMRTEARGANAVELRLAGGGNVVLGPGTTLEFPDAGGLRLVMGQIEVKGGEKAPVHVTGPQGVGHFERDVTQTTWLEVLRAAEATTVVREKAPKWLEGYRASTSEEWMGSLLATVDGKNVPLTVGYHKVTVEIRDQIARTTVEESFVNSTDATLEGTFSFPLPAEASISGFGMWIGDELVEADLVEKQRARQIYEDILRRKKDPGLLEWEGGNLFKARVFPILRHAEKRIRIRYTEVLPLEGDSYRYRYALRSELLRLHPLRELSIALNVVSAAPITDVASPTHPITLRKTEHEAVVEFGAQQYTPERDFEVAVTVGRGPGLTSIAHRRGEDGFFMLLLAPPDEAAAGAKRELIPEGAPLDLILVADTSGSMDPGARAAQSAFLSAVLTQCSAKDRFRLVACDVEPRWIAEEPLAATEENVAKALAALDARFSLGWTDLGKTFDAVLAKARAGTQVIYVGDGIETASDAPPAATADLLRAKGKDSKSTFHAVSTSAAYEKPVLEAISSIGGGSIRRADTGAAQAAKGLLQEIARPSLKDVKVEIKGLPTAKVYPEVLPNVPVGQQQIVLGRFLPGGDAKSAEVVVTGTLAGKPVTYTSSFAVPPSDEDASFLPRLWARRHLDALLARPQSAQTKEEIVAFSREYQIMTPYTSFLVLENDEDRALYGVERTVKMRDAERFFADTRDKAALEIARQQSATAHRWRIDLRRRMLREIATLGRDLPIPAAVGWTDVREDLEDSAYGSGYRRMEATEAGLSGSGAGGFSSRIQGRYEYFDWAADGAVPSPGGDLSGFSLPRESLKSEEADNDMPFEESLGDGGIQAAGRFVAPGGAVPAMTAAPTTPAAMPPPMREPSDPTTPPDMVSDEESPLFGLEGEDRSKEAGEWSAGKIGGIWAEPGSVGDDGSSGIYYGDDVYAPKISLRRSASPDWERGRRNLQERLGAWDGRRRPPFHAWSLGFPDLGGPPIAPPPVADPAWDAATLAALKSLDRRAALSALVGGVRITSDWQSLHPLTGRVDPRSHVEALVDARRRHVRSEGIVQWLSDDERGVAVLGTGLGRRRTATDADRTLWPLPLADRSLGDLVRSLSLSHRRAPKVEQAGDLVTITFAADADAGQTLTLVIDAKRGVLVKERSALDGETTGTTRYSGFVDVAGRTWATKVEVLDADGQVVGRQTVSVEPLDAAAFSAAFSEALAPNHGVVFLGAEEPSLLASKRAVKAGTADFSHRMVIALDRGAHGRFDDMWKAWEKVEPLVAGKRGASWMRLSLLGRSRRGDALLAQAMEMAKEIASSDEPFTAWRAAALDNGTSSLGSRERLALVDAVKSVWSRPGPDADLWSVYGRRREGEALAAAGFPYKARVIRGALAAERPWDVRDLLAHADDLFSGDDLAGATAYVADRIAKGGPWAPGELRALFTRWTNWLWQARDLAGLLAAAEAWMRAVPEDGSGYRIRQACAYFGGGEAAADRWVLEGLKGDVADRRDPAVRAARDVAVQVALGTGWGFSARAVPVEWRAPLADLALRLARSDSRHIGPVYSILGDWRYRQTEERRLLMVSMTADLAADGAVAGMALARLARYVAWVERGADQAADAKIADALVARWRATTDAADAEILAGLVLQVTGDHERRLDFHRERLGRVTDRDARGLAQALFDETVGGGHTLAHEDEAFALLPRLLDARDDAEVNGARAASAARRLAKWIHDARYAAALGGPEDRSKWTRAETVAHTKEAAKRANVETAARFDAALGALGKASALAIGTLTPWIDIERLGYLVEAQTRVEADTLWGGPLLSDMPPARSDALNRLMASRVAAVLAYVATRREAPKDLIDRVLAAFRAWEGPKSDVLDGRYQVFRLLVALDRVADLEEELKAWNDPEDPDTRYSIALAYLYAETNRLPEAVATMEGAATRNDLGGAEWASLAQWYLVLKEDAKRDEALDHALAATQEWQLNQRVWQESSRVSRNGEGVPAELDPEVLRILRFLLRKAQNPASYVGNILNLYRPTKDFRVLECLADGVPGHSPVAVYGYLQAAQGAVDGIFEEATCDQLVARIDQVLAKATLDVDRRALRLLLVAVENRAVAVPKSDPRHGDRALEALRAAFDGPLVPGERALLASHLASIGVSAVPRLAERRIERLEELLAGADDGPLERLAVGRQLSRVLWDGGRREDAVVRLELLLVAARDASDGTLGQGAKEPYDALIAWQTELKHYRPAEARLTADLAVEPRSLRRDALRMRLFALYGQAVGGGGALAIGSGGDLYRAAAAAMEKQMAEGPAYLLPEIVQHHAALFQAAARASAAPDVAATYLAFCRDRLPSIVARVPVDVNRVLEPAAGRLRDLAGPIAALGVLLDHLDRESPWRERVEQGAWSSFHDEMARWRFEAGEVGALEPRLLARVLKKLEMQLTTMGWEGSGFWYRSNRTFWAAHRTDFAAVAARVAELNADNVALVLHVAEYQREGLDLRSESVETLKMAIAHGKEPLELRARLALYLKTDGRHAEAWPLFERLVKEKPDEIEYRVQAAAVLHALKRNPEALRLLEDAVARWKERKAWQMWLAAQVATAALDAGLGEQAAAWIEDALRMRRESVGRGGADGSLASWYGILARARSLLGQTDAAVKAAAAAIVAWGRDQDNRRTALEALRDVLQQAADLDAWIGRYEAEVATSGMDAPTIRKALGQVLHSRHASDRAATQLRAARDLDPADAETHALLVRALDEQHDAAGALEALFASVRMAPKNLAAYPDLAKRYEKAGDAADAERARTNMVEAMPSEPDGHRALAKLRDAGGLWPLAVAEWSIVTRLRADEPEGWIALAEAQIKSGDKVAARATVDHLLHTTWDARFGDVAAQAAKLLDKTR